MEVLTSGEQIQRAQIAFSKSITDLSQETREVFLGFQGGYLAKKVEWVPALNLWAHFGLVDESKSSGSRYWNVFGIGYPRGNMSIDCEVNPPIEGRNRRTGGVFLVDASGNFHVGHRGNFNARGRIPMDFVLSNFRGKKLSVRDGERKAEVFWVGELDKPDFPGLLRSFVTEAVRIKNLARQR